MNPKLTLYAQILVTWVIVIIALTFAANAKEQQESYDDPAWGQFLEWLPSAPQTNGPHELYRTYFSHLISKNISIPEAQRQLEVIFRTMRQSPNGWRIMYNNIYKGANPEFSIQPNALLISTVGNREPGRALDIGMGQGRNSIFRMKALP